MIKLEKYDAPVKLTPEFVAAQTDEFKTMGASVWNIEWLKEAENKMR